MCKANCCSLTYYRPIFGLWLWTRVLFNERISRNAQFSSWNVFHIQTIFYHVSYDILTYKYKCSSCIFLLSFYDMYCHLPLLTLCLHFIYLHKIIELNKKNVYMYLTDWVNAFCCSVVNSYKTVLVFKRCTWNLMLV